MSYNPATDFLGLWRAVAGGVAKESMPGLDFSVSALGRSGLLNVSVSGTQPVVNQSTTAWFQPAAPSYSAEGALQLWNGAAYVAATPRLLLEMLAAAEKAATSSTAISSLMDTLSATRGYIPFRGAVGWSALAPGTVGYLLTSGGAGADPTWSTIGSIGGALDGITNTVGALAYRGAGGWAGTGAGTQWTVLSNSVANTPAWTTLSALIDGALGNAQGDILFRDAGVWNVLAPGGNAGRPLATGGAGANPSWSAAMVPFGRFTGATINPLPSGVSTGSVPAVVSQGAMAFTVAGNNVVCDKTGIYLITASGQVAGDTGGAGYSAVGISVNVNGAPVANQSNNSLYAAGVVTGVTVGLSASVAVALNATDTVGILFNGNFSANNVASNIKFSIIRLQ